MNTSIQPIIDGYLDGMLSPAEEQQLADWLQAAPENAQQFAADVMLHDRLRMLLITEEPPQPAPSAATDWPGLRPRAVRWATAMVAATAAAILLFASGIGFESRSVSAAVLQLDHLIAAQARLPGSCYLITVESRNRPPRQRFFDRTPDWKSRPPKPPLNDATVHASHERFVLVRTTTAGERFITGSDGHSSWAVAPEGPVRVSARPDHFNHDLPGHEHDMPLTTLAEGLEQLRAAYVLRLENGPTPTHRRLIAEKRPRFRGPRRIEIDYEEATGQIESLRFTEMPYGPERLDLRMDLVSTNSYDDSFFSHSFHHSPERIIVEE
jgi:hypothetical protein